MFLSTEFKTASTLNKGVQTPVQLRLYRILSALSGLPPSLNILKSLDNKRRKGCFVLCL